MHTLGQVIKSKLSTLKMTQSWLAEQTGVSDNAVSKWIKTGKISREKAVLAAQALACSVDELLLAGYEDAGELFPGSMSITPTDGPSTRSISIPMVKLRLSAGITGFQTEAGDDDQSTYDLPIKFLKKLRLDSSRLFAIIVHGESMEPALYDGDLVVINAADIKPVDGEVYAINFEGEAVIKRMSRDAGEWWLMSDNLDKRKYHRKLCKGAECIIIGRVVRKESERI